MTALVFAAAALACYFNRPADGSVSADSIPTMTVPLPDALSESMARRDPPVAAARFGESAPNREWIIGGRPGAIPERLLRVELAGARPLPGPFAARYGTVQPGAGGARFVTDLSGYCTLQPTAEANQ